MKRKIVCLGDSVTEGCFELFETACGLDAIRDKENCYVTLLGRLLGDGWEVVNAGVSGHNSGMADERVERDVLPHEPEFCIVCLGLNDMIDSLEKHTFHMRSIFGKLKAAGITPVLLTPTVPCDYVYPKISDFSRKAAESVAKAQNEGALDEMVASDRKLAAEFGAPICDFYAFKTAQKMLGRDVTLDLSNYINHPSREEHKLIAAFLWSAFSQM